jgi:large subunit ribosomal protein L24e
MHHLAVLAGDRPPLITSTLRINNNNPLAPLSGMSNNVSQASLLGLKAITAEHAERFEKEGRSATRGSARPKAVEKIKDPFLRPSPGLVKRLAREARNDSKRRHFDDEGPSDEQRRAILEAKAKKYDALKRGDLSGFTDRELAEANIDVS